MARSIAQNGSSILDPPTLWPTLKSLISPSVDIASYVSDRVYDGIRRPSPATVHQLRDSYIDLERAMLFKEVARKIWNSQRDHLEGWDGFEVAINKLSEEQLIQLDLEMSDIVERALNRMMSKMFAGND